MRNGRVFNQVQHTFARIWALLKSLGMELPANSSVSSLSVVITRQQPGVFDCNSADTTSSGWIRPDADWDKVNIDGALSSSLSSICGGVIRDAGGAWVKGFSRNLGVLSSTNVFLTELLAVKTAVELVMSFCLPRVIVE